MKIEGVVFDMDGVIIDSEPLHFECTLRALQDEGIHLRIDDLNQYVGVADLEMWEDLIVKYNINTIAVELQNRQNDYRDELFIKENMIPVEGIRELLKYLYDKNIKIGLASSSPKYLIEKILKDLDIYHYFDGVVSGEEVKMSKPQPDIYIRAASLIYVDLAFCMAIEDANKGVQAAKAAGMYTIGYYNPNSGEQDLVLADRIINHMNEVIEIIEAPK